MSPILKGVVASGKTASTISTSSYESIQTVTVGSGGAADITFSSIPSTYKHLQIRAIAQSDRGTYGIDNLGIQVGNGSIDTGANYSWHGVYSRYDSGTTPQSNGGANDTYIRLDYSSVGTGVSNSFGANIIDFLDFSNTSKYKTVRTLGVNEINGLIAGYGGGIGLYSGSWRSLSAITTLKFYPLYGSNFRQYTTFALYGIKGA